MSMAMYYTATRTRPLDDVERSVVSDLVDRYATDRFLEHGGESFCLYDEGSTEPDVLLDGATKVPIGSGPAFADAVVHWSALLTELRRALPDADWDVTIDDDDVCWDEAEQRYDLTRGSGRRRFPFRRPRTRRRRLRGPAGGTGR